MFASDYRRAALDRLAGNWGICVGAALVASIFGAASIGSNFNFSIDADTLEMFAGTDMEAFMRQVLLPIVAVLGSIGSVLSFAQFILGGVVSLGYSTFLLDQYDGRPLSVKTLFSKFDQFLDGFLLHLLTDLFTALWTLLFIIPGIVASYRYAMAPFLMAENPGMSARDAIDESKRMMEGHKWELFCLDLSFIGWALLCVLTLGIGSLFLTPYQNASRTAFYRNLCGVTVPTAPATPAPTVEW